jgi:hypothetical protein
MSVYDLINPSNWNSEHYSSLCIGHWALVIILTLEESGRPKNYLTRLM